MSVDVLARLNANAATALRVAGRSVRTEASDGWALGAFACLAFAIMLLLLSTIPALSLPLGLAAVWCSKQCHDHLQTKRVANIHLALAVLDDLDLDSTADLREMEATSANVA